MDTTRRSEGASAAAADKFVSPCSPPTPYEREVLTILIEECAEVQQRATKMLRFGCDEVQPGQALTNSERLAHEMGDLLAMFDVAVTIGLIDWRHVEMMRSKKMRKLAKYMQTLPQESASKASAVSEPVTPEPVTTKGE
jgi:hypothetical protein